MWSLQHPISIQHFLSPILNVQSVNTLRLDLTVWTVLTVSDLPQGREQLQSRFCYMSPLKSHWESLHISNKNQLDNVLLKPWILITLLHYKPSPVPSDAAFPVRVPVAGSRDLLSQVTQLPGSVCVKPSAVAANKTSPVKAAWESVSKKIDLKILIKKKNNSKVEWHQKD